MGFPEGLAQNVNQEKKPQGTIKFRNYHKYVSKDTLDVLGIVEETEAQASATLQEVSRVERIYERKAAKAIK